MRRKAWYRSALLIQFMTFLLGMLVGACLLYALSDIFMGDQTAETTQTEGLAAADKVLQSPDSVVDKEEEPVVIQATYAIEPVPGDLETLWPLRHVIIGVEGVQLSRASIEMLNSWKPAGVWLRENNTETPQQIEEMISLINLYASLDGSRDKNPLICMMQEGGTGKNPLHMEGALSYQEIAALESLEAIKKAGVQVAETALDTGVGVLLAPRLDVFSPGKTPARDRAFYLNDDHGAVIQAGLAYASGLIEGGALAVVGNYPGMGSAVHQSLRLPIVEETDIERLAETMLPFAEAVASDISGILVGNVVVPTLDKEQSDRPAALSPRLVREVLRRQFGYTGVVLAADILEVAVWSGNEPEADIVAALKAGCDAVFISDVSGEELGRIAQEITSAVASGALKKEELDASARRLDVWRQHLSRRLPASLTAPDPDPVPEEEAQEEVVEEITAPEQETELEDAEDTETADAAEAVEDVEEETQEEAPISIEEIEEALEETVSESVAEETEDVEESQETLDAAATEIIEEEATEEEVTVVVEVQVPAEELLPEEKEKEISSPVEEKKEEKAPEVVRVSAPQPAGTRALSYTIEPGDTLSKIAATYNVSTSNLMQWNGLSNGDIKFGKKLTIYVADLPQAEKEASLPEETEKPVADDSVWTEEEASVEEEMEAVSEEMPAVEEAEKISDTAEKAMEEDEELPPPLAPSPETEGPVESDEMPDEVLDDKAAPEEAVVETPEAIESIEEANAVANEAEETVAVESDETPSMDTSPSSEDRPEETADPYAIHTIEQGDTLHSIAKRYNTTVQNLIKINELKDANVIVLGGKLKVPAL